MCRLNQEKICYQFATTWFRWRCSDCRLRGECGCFHQRLSICDNWMKPLLSGGGHWSCEVGYVVNLVCSVNIFIAGLQAIRSFRSFNKFTFCITLLRKLIVLNCKAWSGSLPILVPILDFCTVKHAYWNVVHCVTMVSKREHLVICFQYGWRYSWGPVTCTTIQPDDFLAVHRVQGVSVLLGPVLIVHVGSAHEEALRGFGGFLKCRYCRKKGSVLPMQLDCDTWLHPGLRLRSLGQLLMKNSWYQIGIPVIIEKTKESIELGTHSHWMQQGVF